ncbi:hypothetical protein [Spirosoma sp. 48-14]|nr:hypothetical protein [Spirosoma sp. 48-14]OJW78102.1 MAG: hypothetical protein BGO59_29220 [Spirosoma sp. 48-14]
MKRPMSPAQVQLMMAERYQYLMKTLGIGSITAQLAGSAILSDLQVQVQNQTQAQAKARS